MDILKHTKGKKHEMVDNILMKEYMVVFGSQNMKSLAM